jgi:hypothetical protein
MAVDIELPPGQQIFDEQVVRIGRELLLVLVGAEQH